MISEEEFYQKWHGYFKANSTPKEFRKHGPRYPDEEFMDKILLIVVDEMPTKAINDIFSGNMEHFDVGRSEIWLADYKYDNLPEFSGFDFTDGTPPTVDSTWQSPFVGKSLADAAAWIRGVPKPPKAVSKTFIAALQKDLYESRGMVLICKIVKGESEPQTIPYIATHIAGFHAAYYLYRDNWQEDWRKQVSG